MKGTVRSIVRYIGIAVLSVVVILMAAWAAMAIYYSNLPGGYLRSGIVGLFVFATAAAFLFLPKRRRCCLVDDNPRLEYAQLAAGGGPCPLCHDRG
jgi:hypothetical protein